MKHELDRVIAAARAALAVLTELFRDWQSPLAKNALALRMSAAAMRWN